MDQLPGEIPILDEIAHWFRRGWSWGVLQDLHCSWINKVLARLVCAFYQLWLIHQLHPLKKYLVTIIHDLLSSRLNYWNALYIALSLERFWKLQVIQKAATQENVLQLQITVCFHT